MPSQTKYSALVYPNDHTIFRLQWLSKLMLKWVPLIQIKVTLFFYKKSHAKRGFYLMVIKLTKTIRFF